MAKQCANNLAIWSPCTQAPTHWFSLNSDTFFLSLSLFLSLFLSPSNALSPLKSHTHTLSISLSLLQAQTSFFHLSPSPSLSLSSFLLPLKIHCTRVQAIRGYFLKDRGGRRQQLLSRLLHHRHKAHPHPLSLSHTLSHSISLRRFISNLWHCLS